MKRYIFSILMFVVFGCVLEGCFAADRANILSSQANHHVTVYSGGVAVKSYDSIGAVMNEGKSDGFFFMDKATGKLVQVSGTVVIEQE